MRIVESWKYLDQKLIDGLDRLTGYAQKQRGWRLTRGIVLLLGANLVFYGTHALTVPDYVGLFFSALWLIELKFQYDWAWQNDDYPENWRKAVSLNASAAVRRYDSLGFWVRWILLQVFTSTILIDAFLYVWRGEKGVGFLLDASGVCLTMYFYLRCCTFLTFTPRQKQAWLGRVAPDVA